MQLVPKTVGDLREWLRQCDEYGPLYPSDWIVMVTDGGIQVCHPRCHMMAATFSTEPEEVCDA